MQDDRTLSQQEARLRSSEDKFHKVFHATSIAMTLSGIDDGVVVDANDRFLELLGKRREEVIGHSTMEFKLWSNPEQRARAVAQLKEGGRFREFEADLRSGSGERHVYLCSGDQVQVDGRPMLLVSAIDITARKAAEAALRESESRFSAFMDHLPSMVLIKDDELRLVYANRRFREYFPADEWMGKRPEESFPPEVAQRMIAMDREALSRGYCEYEETWLNKERSLRNLRTQKFQIKRADAPLLGAIITDITEQRRAEETLRNSQRLEALGNLAGGIAHDFNNLLGGLFGFLSLAREIADAGSEMATYLDKALAAFSRARSLTQQLLTFSKGGEPIKKVIDLRLLLQEVVCFALSGSSSMPVFQLDEALAPVEVDPGQIGQVIDNIALNARQAMPTGGTLTVRASNATAEEIERLGLPPGRYVRVAFSDCGVGIPEVHLQRIFDPFFTTKQQGSGLGLATSYSIVKKHGGTIEADSRPGLGATLRCYLPAAASEAVPARSSRPPRRAEGMEAHGRVLVMDDEQLVRDVMTAALHRLGFEVTCVESGQRAVASFDQAVKEGKPYCAAILDLTVPGGMGGGEVAAIIGSRHKGFPMIVASGYSDDPVMADPEAYGFVGRLAKPFQIRDVRAVLEAVLALDPR